LGGLPRFGGFAFMLIYFVPQNYCRQAYIEVMASLGVDELVGALIQVFAGWYIYACLETVQRRARVRPARSQKSS
jgi:hypothetical protein